MKYLELRIHIYCQNLSMQLILGESTTALGVGLDWIIDDDVENVIESINVA